MRADATGHEECDYDGAERNHPTAIAAICCLYGYGRLFTGVDGPPNDMVPILGQDAVDHCSLEASRRQVRVDDALVGGEGGT